MSHEPIHILLVEDNSADAELTRETLEESKLQLDIAVVRDGDQALDYLNGHSPFADAKRPDLILLDLNLPRRSGTEVLSAIKNSENLASIPVIVLTSSEAERDIAHSYSLGASCFVTKPVGLEAFQSIVRAVDHFWFSVVKLPQ